MTKERKCFEQYYKYMQEITPILLEAENTARTIKNSKEWKRASNYFKVLYKRGHLKENPCYKNSYKIELIGASVQLEDIKDILTPEQLEQVKKLATNWKE